MNDHALTPMQTFQESIKSRLKDDIAELLPDEALADLIERSIEEMFFADKVTKNNFHDIVEPSWFNQLVVANVQTRVTEATQAYLRDNRNDIDAKIETAILRAMPAAVEDLTVTLRELVQHMQMRMT